MSAARFTSTIRAALATQDPPLVSIATRKGRFSPVLHPLLFVRMFGRTRISDQISRVIEHADQIVSLLADTAAGGMATPFAFRRALQRVVTTGKGRTGALFDVLYAALQCAVWEQSSGERLFGSTTAEETLCIIAGLGRGIDQKARIDHAAHISHFLVHAAVMLSAVDGITLGALVSAVDERLSRWGEEPAHPTIVQHAAFNLFIDVADVPDDDRDYDVVREGRAALNRGCAPIDVYRTWWDTLGWRRADMLVRLLAPDHRRPFYIATRDAVQWGELGDPATAAIRIGFVDECGTPYLRGHRIENDVVLRFPGGSTIGRSATMYEGGGTRLLFDIGGDNYGRYPNWSPEMHDLDAVFITHAHHDHIGGLFHLYEELGFMGRWHADPITIACTRLALEDSLRLQEVGDRLSPDSRRRLDHVMDRAVPIKAGQVVAVGVAAVTGYHAGHVPGALQYLVESCAGGRIHRTMISGDINPGPSLSVQPMTLPSEALRAQVDALVVEGTNALRADDQVVGGASAQSALWSLLEAQERWPVLLPVMSLGRAQEVIAALANTRWRVGVFGLAARMTVASGLKIPQNVSLISTQWRDVARNEYDVLVASAGSLQGGPARYFREDSGWDPPVIFTGYLFPGTPAHALADQYPRVRFSGHASADSWQSYCDAFPAAKRFLVHYPGAHALAEARDFIVPRADRAYTTERRRDA